MEAVLPETSVDVGVLFESRDLSTRLLSSAEQESILASEDPALIASLASNPCLDATHLTALADHPDEVVRWYLACNASLPPEVQEALSNEDTEGVLGCLASNSAVKPSIVERLSRHPFKYVRESAAENPALREDVALRLAVDLDLDVRTALAAKFPMTPDVAEILEGDLDFEVGQCLMRNPSYEVGMDTSARFVWRHAQAFLEALGGEVDLEALQALAPSWEGTLRTLVEATRLIER